MVAVMNSRLRCGPPKVRLAAASGRCNLPISVPSGSKQCTPSPTPAHTRPALSRRMPSNTPDVHSANSRALAELAVFVDRKDADVVAPVSAM